VGLYYRFPLSLRMVEELLAARGIQLTYGTVRRWSVKFGLGIARRIRSTVLARADKWQLDGRKHWLWRAVDQHGAALDVLVQRPGKHGRAPRVLITDQLRSYAAANRDLGLRVEHRQHKGLNYRAENSHQPTRGREKVMRRFKSARHLQRFASVHDQVGNLFLHCRYHTDAKQKRALRAEGFDALESVTGALMLGRLAD
jgi:putative transposase